jgi:hypothetical protein
MSRVVTLPYLCSRLHSRSAAAGRTQITESKNTAIVSGHASSAVPQSSDDGSSSDKKVQPSESVAILAESPAEVITKYRLGVDGCVHRQVAEMQQCTICHDILRDPVECNNPTGGEPPCGHVFCRTCITTAIETKSPFGQATNERCPECRQALRTSQLRPSVTRSRDVARLVVKCPFAACGAHITYGQEGADLVSHIARSCRHAIWTCAGCGTSRTTDTGMRVHKANECGATEITCPHAGCLELVTRRCMKQHVEDMCRYTSIPCTYADLGCSHAFPRIDEAKHMREAMVDHMALLMERMQEMAREHAELKRVMPNFVPPEPLDTTFVPTFEVRPREEVHRCCAECGSTEHGASAAARKPDIGQRPMFRAVRTSFAVPAKTRLVRAGETC